MKTAVAVCMIAIAAACSPGERDQAVKSTQSKLTAAPHYSSATALSRAESLYFAAEYDSAANIWRQALSTDSVKSDSATQAHILMWLGMREWRLGNYDSARAIAERSLALKLRLGRTRELSRSYNSLGLIARDEGRLRDARDLFGKAIETARAANDTAGINRGAINLALVQQDLGNFDEAQKGFETARDAGHTLGDARLEGNALNNLGALLIKMGDAATAVTVLHEAVDRYKGIEYQTGLQNSLGQLATAYDVLGDPQRAFALLDTASRMAQAQGLKQEQENNLRLFGELYQGVGDHQRALDYLSRARTLSTQLGLDQETAIILRAEARSHLATGRLDLARARMEEALRMHRKEKVLFEEMTDLLSLSELGSDNPNRGRAYIDSAKAIAKRIDTPSARADVGLAGARLAARMRDWRRVIALLQPADKDLRNARASGMWEADALRARAYAGLGLLDSAVLSGRTAVGAVERVRSRIGTGSLRTSFTSERSAIYADLVIALLRSNKSAEAFEVADAARGRELLEHLAEAKRDVSSKGVSDIAEGEKLLRQINELTRLLNEADRVPQRERAAAEEERLNALSERLAQLESEYEGLASRTSRDNRVRSRILGTAHADLSQVTTSLEPNEAIVEYMVTPERVLVFVVRRERLTQLIIDVEEQELAGRVRVARGLAGKRTPLDARDDAVFRALHALLITPVEKSGALRGINRIIVVPHSELVYLPFATLMDENGKYLSDRYAILHAPSAAALVSLRSRPGIRGKNSRAVVLAPFPAMLPSTVQEARNVRRSISPSRMLLGSSANERALRDALADAKIVHVASHGFLNRRNPLFSRIELAQPASVSEISSRDDGRLDLHEVFGMKIGSQLVFLSGCETGLGAAWSTDFARGEDFATLAQAFLYSGAREVVATLWRLDDEAAAVFASSFYKNLKTAPPAEALAAAQREIRSDERFKAPYNWAAYTLSGSGERLNMERSWWNPFN
jgi:CHAT domain-containing protein/tetratricopeptide (TPR) repeat protein